MKRDYFKYSCLTLGLMAAVILPSTLQAEGPAGPGGPPPKKERPEWTPEQREEMKQKRLDKMAEKLGLDDSQKERVAKIMEEQGEKMKALKDDESLSKEDRLAKFKKIAEEGREKMDAVLTAEQKEKMGEMKKNFGPGKPHGPKGDKKDGTKDKAPEAPQPTA